MGGVKRRMLCWYQERARPIRTRGQLRQRSGPCDSKPWHFAIMTLSSCTLSRVRLLVCVGGCWLWARHIKGGRCQLKRWEGKKFLCSPQAANTQASLLSYRSPFRQSSGPSPALTPYCLFSQPVTAVKQLPLEALSRLKCRDFCLKLLPHSVQKYIDSNTFAQFSITPEICFYSGRNKREILQNKTLGQCISAWGVLH